ncbi:MAG TPA: MerR family transcriptional regulator [Deltaproteobacteria bacterium]|nr:MAG: MerR family transcriptional regulator [bacterium]HDH10546.1 MerR family transcriptional regulator [Deltaproteobacteria bacterium]
MNRVYTIGEVAQMLKVHPQTIRAYENAGFVKPARSAGGFRYFNSEDIRHLKTILLLTKDLGVNLAGVEIISRMINQINDMHTQIEYLVEKIQREIDRNYEYHRSKALVPTSKYSIIKIDIVEDD